MPLLRLAVGLVARVPAYIAGAVFAVRYRLARDRRAPPDDPDDHGPEPLRDGSRQSSLRFATIACPCCGYLTLDGPGERVCQLCGWGGRRQHSGPEGGAAAGGESLGEARAAFKEQMRAYMPGPLLSQLEWLAKRQIIDALEALKRRHPGEREELWESIANCQDFLRFESNRRRREAAERCGPRRPRIPIGYWHADSDDGLPHPQALVDWDWEPSRRWKIVRYLESGQPAIMWRGFSYCRIGCWRDWLGRLDLTDGLWVWPEGLAHYVAFHGVRLPDEFVAYAAINDFRIAAAPGFEHVTPNWETFWEDWSREHARFDYEPNCWACAQERGVPGAGFFSRWQMLGRRVLRPGLRWADRWKRPAKG